MTMQERHSTLESITAGWPDVLGGPPATPDAFGELCRGAGFSVAISAAPAGSPSSRKPGFWKKRLAKRTARRTTFVARSSAH